MTALRIIGRKEALNAGLPHYFTGKPCKSGHVAPRYARNGTCHECRRIAALSRHYANPEYSAEKSKRFHQRNPDYADRNRERINAVSRDYIKRNRAKYNMYSAERRARLRQAIPPWFSDADRAEIAKQYKAARVLTEKTGIPHEVDHIAPLAGKNICGLHVAKNLRIVPAAVNKRKSNTFHSEIF